MTLNDVEQKYFSHLFSLADNDRDGKVSGKEGAPFLRKSELSDKSLERIWELSDTTVSGFLGPREFAIAMRLVAHAQSQSSQKNGVEPTLSLENIKNVTILPRFTGVPTPVVFPSSFTAEDIHKYDHLFLHADLNKDGFIDGVEAKTYFSKAKIPQDKLAKIWELSEMDGDGKLNLPEFRVAMHLIYWSLKNEELPHSVSTSLIAASKQIPPAAVIPTTQQFNQVQNTNNNNNNLYFGAPQQGFQQQQQQNQMGYFQGNPVAYNQTQDDSQNFVSPPAKLGDPSVKGSIHQYTLPGASFETRINFQNDLTQALNNRQKN
eukprot:TRINITY_DN935_c0_g1_i2.p2 TRINITY_DN935_c0_g1~~TRINITY_DN935_c0_g1_i2.p2  ORF type:complete len:319 (-),score=90.03 TRINITY_DN935_c0_g1_i2:48-1004(-)